jgi:hypothetical protein
VRRCSAAFSEDSLGEGCVFRLYDIPFVVEDSAHTVRFAAANPSSGGHVADISATSVRMFPETFWGSRRCLGEGASAAQKKDCQTFAVSIKNVVSLALTPFDP